MPKVSLRVAIGMLSIAVSLISSATLSYLGFRYLYDAKLHSVENEYSSSLETLTPLITSAFENVERDVLTLSRLPPIDGLARSISNGGVDPKDGSTTALWTARLAQIFKSMVDHRDMYFQIRLIDGDSGMELVRVDRDVRGESIIVETLQVKSDEDYFQPALSIETGEIYYSNISLNREFGKITTDHQVTLRIATPAADQEGNPYGFVIINVNYPAMMERLLSQLRWGNTHYLIDHNGNYLEYEPFARLAKFGSATDDVSSIRISDYFNSLDSNKTIHEVADGKGGTNLIVTKHIELAPDSGWLYLLLASSTPKQKIDAELSVYRHQLIGWCTGVILICGLLAYLLAETVVGPIVKTVKSLQSYTDEKGTLALNESNFSELSSLSKSIKEAVSSTVQAAESEANALAKYEVIFNTAADGIITSDRFGKIISVNPAANAMFGYKTQELNGQNLKVLMTGEIKVQHDAFLKNYTESKESTIIGKSRDLMGVRKCGEEFPIEIAVTSQWDDGELTLIGMLRDISQRKQRELELKCTLRELKSSNEELDDFAYVVSHDLREPLRINTLAEKMQGQVSDLLYFSRLGRTELNLEPINSQLFVEEVISSLDGFLEENNAEVVINDPLPVIAADKSRLNSIFTNLITNGVKYNASSRKMIEVGYRDQLEVSAGRAKQVFSIKDNGIGIDKQFHRDVFRIFKRLNAEAEFGGGTGAGLTFVKKSVEKHGGCIWLESTPSQGTTFYFTLKEQSFSMSDEEISESTDAYEI